MKINPITPETTANAASDATSTTAAASTEETWVGAYGFGGHHGPGYEPQPGETRDAWDRAADSFLAMVGDADAQKRLASDRLQAGLPATPAPSH